MKKTTLITPLLIGLLLSTGIAIASPGGQGGRHWTDSCNRNGQGMTDVQHAERMEQRLEKMAVILDLTEQQQEQLKNVFAKNWQDHQAMRAELQASRNALREDQQAATFNEADFRAKAQKHADLTTEMMVQRARTKQQVFAILTPEQQQKAEELRGLRGEGFFGPHDGNRECDGRRDGNRKCAAKGFGQRWNN